MLSWRQNEIVTGAVLGGIDPPVPLVPPVPLIAPVPLVPPVAAMSLELVQPPANANRAMMVRTEFLISIPPSVRRGARGRRRGPLCTCLHPRKNQGHA